MIYYFLEAKIDFSDYKEKELATMRQRKISREYDNFIIIIIINIHIHIEIPIKYHNT